MGILKIYVNNSHFSPQKSAEKSVSKNLMMHSQNAFRIVIAYTVHTDTTHTHQHLSPRLLTFVLHNSTLNQTSSKDPPNPTPLSYAAISR